MRGTDSDVDARMRGLKQRIAAVLADCIDGWPLGDAGAMLEMSRGLVSDLRRGRVDRVTLDRLIRAAMQIGFNTEIVITSRVGRDTSVLGRLVPLTGVGVPASERDAFPNPGYHPEEGHEPPRHSQQDEAAAKPML